MTPKWVWTLKKLRYPICTSQLPQSSKFTSVLLYSQPFWSYRPFWEKCTEWPQYDINSQISLNTTRSITAESQISLRFTLRPTLFNLQAILRQVHWMTLMILNTTRSKVPIYIYHSFPRDPNLTPFRSTASCFRVTGHFETSVPNYPKMIWNPKTVKGNPCCSMLQLPRSRKFRSVSLYDLPFPRYCLFFFFFFFNFPFCQNYKFHFFFF